MICWVFKKSGRNYRNALKSIFTLCHSHRDTWVSNLPEELLMRDAVVKVTLILIFLWSAASRFTYFGCSSWSYGGLACCHGEMNTACHSNNTLTVSKGKLCGFLQHAGIFQWQTISSSANSFVQKENLHKGTPLLWMLCVNPFARNL